MTAASLETFSTTAAASVPRGCGERAEQRFRQAERPHQIGRQRPLEILALGVAEERERRGPEIGRVVDQDVESAELAENLERDGIDGVLRRDVADDAVDAGVAALDRFDAVAAARDEGDARAGAVQGTDERQSETGRPACDGDPQVGAAGQVWSS